MPPVKTIISWWSMAGGISPTRNLPAATPMQSIPLWHSSAPGSGLMVVTHGLTISRIGKHSEASWQHPWCWSGDILWMSGFGG